MANPTRAKVVEALEKAGVQFDAEATLKDLMPLYEKLPAEGATSTDADKKDEEEDTGGKGSATVYNKTGAPVRTYTKAVHGKEYKDLAKEYATKIGGSVR